MSELAQRRTGLVLLFMAFMSGCVGLSFILPLELASVVSLLGGMAVGAFVVGAWE